MIPLEMTETTHRSEYGTVVLSVDFTNIRFNPTNPPDLTELANSGMSPSVSGLWTFCSHHGQLMVVCVFRVRYRVYIRQ